MREIVKLPDGNRLRFGVTTLRDMKLWLYNKKLMISGLFTDTGPKLDVISGNVKMQTSFFVCSSLK